MNAKDYEAEWKLLNSSPEAKQRSDAAKAHAFSEFKKRAFHVQTYPDSKHELTSIQIAKQLEECFFQMAMAPGKTH